MNGNKRKGFASMSRELRKEIASAGARATIAKGTHYKMSSEAAKKAAARRWKLWREQNQKAQELAKDA